MEIESFFDRETVLPKEEKEEYLRQGCKFSGRCPEVMEICKQKVPEDISFDDVIVKCHLYHK